jgi:hypothetical protein
VSFILHSFGTLATYGYPASSHIVHHESTNHFDE